MEDHTKNRVNHEGYIIFIFNIEKMYTTKVYSWKVRVKNEAN